MLIREANEADFEGIWPIFHAIVWAGDTYAYPTETSKTEARQLWMEVPRKTFIETVGRLPRAFNHPSRGYIDALVMYKWLPT